MMLSIPFLAGHMTGSPWISIALLLVKVVVIWLVIWLVAPRLVPRMLSAIARTGSNELFLLSIGVLCFAVAWATSLLGLSLALGRISRGPHSFRLRAQSSHTGERASVSRRVLELLFRLHRHAAGLALRGCARLPAAGSHTAPDPRQSAGEHGRHARGRVAVSPFGADGPVARADGRVLAARARGGARRRRVRQRPVSTHPRRLPFLHGGGSGGGRTRTASRRSAGARSHAARDARRALFHRGRAGSRSSSITS